MDRHTWPNSRLLSVAMATENYTTHIALKGDFSKVTITADRLSRNTACWLPGSLTRQRTVDLASDGKTFSVKKSERGNSLQLSVSIQSTTRTPAAYFTLSVYNCNLKSAERNVVIRISRTVCDERSWLQRDSVRLTNYSVYEKSRCWSAHGWNI